MPKSQLTVILTGSFAIRRRRVPAISMREISQAVALRGVLGPMVRTVIEISVRADRILVADNWNTSRRPPG